MGYRIIKVTPSLAEKYLDINTKNRFLRKAHVGYLEQLILNGEWRLIGEPIRFTGSLGKDGSPGKRCILLDGQHRLKAFLKSGKRSLDFEVIDELPADSFQYMDQGRPRSAADTLSIAGYKNTNVLAGVGRGLYLFNHGGIKEYWMTAQGGKRKATNHEVLAFVQENDKQIHFAIKQATHHMARLSMSLSVHGAAYFMFRNKSVDACEKFFYQLGTGEKLTKTNPITHLRSILLDHRLSRKRAKRMNIHTRDLMMFVILAWNAFRDGQRITSRNVLMDFDSDSLPRAIK